MAAGGGVLLWRVMRWQLTGWILIDDAVAQTTSSLQDSTGICRGIDRHALPIVGAIFWPQKVKHRGKIWVKCIKHCFSRSAWVHCTEDGGWTLGPDGWTRREVLAIDWISGEENAQLWQDVVWSMRSPAFLPGHDVHAAGTTIPLWWANAWMPGAAAQRELHHSAVRHLEGALAAARRSADFADRIFHGTLLPHRAISRAPEEVWSMIFDLLRGEGETLRALTSVSKHFRTVATASRAASVWNPVVFIWLSENQYRWTVLKLERVLQSGSARVSVSLRGVRPETLDQILNAQRYVQLTICDWYSQEAEGSESDPEELRERMRRNRWPRPDVQELCIEGSCGSSAKDWKLLATEDGDGLPDWGEALPVESRSVRWRATPRCLTLYVMIRPEVETDFVWEEIEEYTELGTMRVGWEIPALHLASFKNLCVLRLAGVLLPSTGGNIVLERLKSLEVVVEWAMYCNSRAKGGGVFFGKLTCPRLQTLRLRGDFWDGLREDGHRPWPAKPAAETPMSRGLHASLTAFLKRSPALCTLEFSMQVTCPFATLKNHLRATPELLHLVVSPLLCGAELFEGSQALTLLPELRTLGVPLSKAMCDKWDDIGWNALEGMCRARFGQGSLRTLDLRWQEDVEDDRIEDWGKPEVWLGKARWMGHWLGELGSGPLMAQEVEQLRMVGLLEGGWDIRFHGSPDRYRLRSQPNQFVN
ncbi:hypothetical protein FB451DRAFT_1175852 [Mycena latifolia]|nr:hypothetical protein FB451DRAFT_1175852 [Mycena latifolia]